MRIVIVTAGEVDNLVLQALSREMEQIFGYSIEIHPPIEVPIKYFNKKRQQYDVSGLLSGLKKIRLNKGEKILAVTGVDLFAEGLNFVFGQAELGGSAAAISLARLKQEFYGSPPDPGLLLERALKEAVHELGHTFGLGHCQDPKCVMHFSNSLPDTDIKGNAFCPRCQPKLIA